ncbi:MAG TPA: DMT family transporter [Myxococcales bacterium]|nr:DMT family transporter [Myxococcales bacterium]
MTAPEGGRPGEGSEAGAALAGSTSVVAGAHPPSHPSPRRVAGGVVAGVVCVSFAAIFIRAAAAPPISTAAWRLIVAGVPLGLAALLLRRAELAALTRRQWGMAGASGVALALHFGTWIASLKLTSVASSVALVTTQPVWVAILSRVFLREPITSRLAAGIALALAGAALIGGADVSLAGNALPGDALALAGAVFAAAYFVIGRGARAKLSLLSYVGVVYPAAAVALVLAAGVGGQPLSGFLPRTWLFLALLGLVPQLCGHSLLNWALRYLPAPRVSLAILMEPVVATLLAIPILGERPGPLTVLGAAVTLAGIYLASS